MIALKEKIFCLIVDDEEDIVRGLKDSLIKLGTDKKNIEIEYLSAGNAKQAITKMTEYNISIFILDYNLGDGVNSSIIIQRIINANQKLIYLISGEDGEDLADVVRIEDSIQFLSKPIKDINITNIYNKIISYSKNMLNERIKEYYRKNQIIFEEIQESLEKDIEILLDNYTNLIKIESRIKEYDSFYKKVRNSNYMMKKTNDFFGLRIVCCYISDIDIIINILKKEFSVSIIKYKQDSELFGYRSIHLIVEINNNWCNVPRYEKMKNIVFEIQIRTVVMHAWASVSHNLFYKKENTSEELNRKLSRLSAILEDADISFDMMSDKC